jgi:16S rRNA (cytosine1402-N4)-methyltransferase
LKAEDILNSWPDTELGRILREFGEESNWRSLQDKIVKARLQGGLHSTGQLVNLIQNATPWRRGSSLSILPLKFSCGFALYTSS